MRKLIPVILTVTTLFAAGTAHASRVESEARPYAGVAEARTLALVRASGPAALLASGTLEGKLNVNTATETEWALLPGIGPATAKKLVGYRGKHKFTATNQVMRIKGIGSKTYKAIKPFLSTEGPTTLHVVKTPKAK